VRLLRIAVCGVLLCLALPARADTVALSAGGSVDGNVIEIRFKSDGQQTTHPRDAVVDAWLSSTGSDHLTLKDGTRIKGEVTAVTVHSAAGEIRLTRDRIRSVRFERDPLMETWRAMYKSKGEELNAEDPKAVLALAEWCLAKGLKTEGLGLAEDCLRLLPEKALADQAHKLLGHLRYDGMWMTPEAMQERIAAERGGGVDEEPGGEGEQEVREILEEDLSPKELLAKTEELCRAQIKRAEREGQDAVRVIQGKHKIASGKIRDRVRELKGAIAKEKENAKKVTERVAHVAAAHRKYTKPGDSAEEKAQKKRIWAFEAALKKARALGPILDREMRARAEKARQRAEARKSRLRRVRHGHKVIVREGGAISIRQMIAEYEKAYEG